MRKLLVALMALLCMTGVVFAEGADAFTEGDFSYTLTEEGAVITEYRFDESWPEVLEISAELGGKPVMGIAEGAFTVCQAEITFASTIPHLNCEDGFLIDTRTDTLLYTMPSSRGKELPAVRRLGKWSLISWAEWDMDAVIPEGAEEMGAFLFQDTAMTSLVLPSTLRLIEQDTIDGEIAQSVEIPASVEIIQRGNFTRGEMSL